MKYFIGVPIFLFGIYSVIYAFPGLTPNESIASLVGYFSVSGIIVLIGWLILTGGSSFIKRIMFFSIAFIILISVAISQVENLKFRNSTGNKLAPQQYTKYKKTNKVKSKLSTPNISGTNKNIKCIKGECVNGYGTFVYQNGDKYVGNWKSGKMHGQGTMYSKGGGKYIGKWKYGTIDGGKQYWANGKIALYEFKNGKMKVTVLRKALSKGLDPNEEVIISQLLKVKSELEQVAKDLNTQLPIKTHDGITLHKVSTQSLTIIYSYTYPIKLNSSNSNTSDLKRVLKKHNTSYFCNHSDTKIFRQKEITYQTIYYDLNGVVLANIYISVQDC